MRWIINTTPPTQPAGPNETIIELATTIDAAMAVVQFEILPEGNMKSKLREFFIHAKIGDNYICNEFSIIAVPANTKAWGNPLLIYKYTGKL